MGKIQKAFRQQRYKVKEKENITVKIQTKTGAIYELKVNDISLSGIGCTYTGILNDNDGVSSNDIIPSAKLLWPGSESSLGRLVFKNLREDSEIKIIGLSLIDMRVPLDGSLSKYLEFDKNQKNPFAYELNPDKFNLANFAEGQSSSEDLFSKCKQFSLFYDQWKKSEKFLYENIRTPSSGVRVKLERNRTVDRKDYIVMGSNDYLGFASHPRVIKAAKDALDDYGFGSTGSPVSTGKSKVHLELEEYLSHMFHKEKTLLFNSGYATNLGVLSGLTDANDLVVADILCHASIQDGLQLATCTSRFFKHNDLAHLRQILNENRKNHSGCLIVTEGIFSMDGDYPNILELTKIAEEFNARLFVDEAHSFGVLGDHGLGVCDKFHCLDKVDLIMGTFSKVCGGIGGFVSGPKEVIDWLFSFSKSFIFSVMIPPSTAAAVLESLKIFNNDRSYLDKLRKNITHFARGLRNLGFDINDNHESAVIPVVIGDEKKLGEMLKIILDDGVFVVPVVYPAVSRKAARFRFTIMANHSISDLDYALHVLEKAIDKCNFQITRNEIKKAA